MTESDGLFTVECKEVARETGTVEGREVAGDSVEWSAAGLTWSSRSWKNRADASDISSRVSERLLLPTWLSSITEDSPPACRMPDFQ